MVWNHATRKLNGDIEDAIITVHAHYSIASRMIAHKEQGYSLLRLQGHSVL